MLPHCPALLFPFSVLRLLFVTACFGQINDDDDDDDDDMRISVLRRIQTGLSPA